jgi:glycosyltransferase involved in cell wall biosynthesis
MSTLSPNNAFGVERSRLIVVGPVPPPYHGVTVSTQLVLANERLRDVFARVEHLDTSDRRPVETIGRWDVTNVALGLVQAFRLWRALRGTPGVVYLPLSQNLGAFLRDSLFIQLAHVRGWRVAAHLRGSEFRERFYEERSRLTRAYIRFTLRRLDSLAVMGPALRSLFRGLVPRARIAVVPNGTPEPQRDGVDRDPWRVLFLSNLRRRKGVVEAVDAARAIVQAEPRAEVVFVGEWDEPGLEAAVRARTNGEARIRFGAPVVGAEKDELLAGSSILLFPPTEPEGHPRVVLEAMAAGLPVVATDRGAIRDTVVHGETGFVLDDADPEELADRVLALLRDDDLRERMSRAARERYLAHFTQARADEVLAEWLATVAA